MYLGLCKGHDDRTARARACLKEAMSHLLTLKEDQMETTKLRRGTCNISLHLALCSEELRMPSQKQDGMSERGRQCWEKEGLTDVLPNCPKCLLDTVYLPGFKKPGQTKSRI